MPIYESVIVPVFSFVSGFLSKLLYDKYKAPELLYQKDFPHYPLEDGLIFPIKVFNSKEKTLHDIKLRIEFNSPIQNIEVATNLVDHISPTVENRTLVSNINRLNRGNYITYFVKLVDIERNPFRDISIESDEVIGKEYVLDFSGLFNRYEVFYFIILGILLGIGITKGLKL